MVADTIKEVPEYSRSNATKCGLKLETNCFIGILRTFKFEGLVLQKYCLKLVSVHV